MKKLAIITAAPSAASEPAAERLYKHIADNLEDTEVVVFHIRDLEYVIEDQEAFIRDRFTKRDIADFDFVYTKFWYMFDEEAYTIGMYLAKKGVASMPKAFRSTFMRTKLTQYYGMWANEIPVPDTYFSPTNYQLKEIVAEVLEKSPEGCIVKDRHGGKGRNNYFVRSLEEFEQKVERNDSLLYVVQGFIPNELDYRMLVFGDEVKIIMERSRSKENDTHLNNTSQGASAKQIPVNEFNPEWLDLSVKTAQIFGRTFAGVDLLISTDGKPYILEVNETPQIGSGELQPQKYEAMTNFLRSLLDQ